MKKKGQAEIVGGIILGLVLFVGIFGTHDALEDNRYVVDPETNTTYDLLKCDIDMDQSNFKLIKDIEGFDNENYKMAECSE